jgi:hypothetical protein
LPDDADGDGFGIDEDCDDSRADVNPGAPELCNGIDDDCSGEFDEGDAIDAVDWYADADGDGWGNPDDAQHACVAEPGRVAQGGDCDDTNPAFHPGAEESDCTDFNDYNCDGSVATADADADGYAACEDCDDGNAGSNPSALEACDGADNDCDGDVDEASATDALTWYADADADGYGSDDDIAAACAAPEGYAALAGDCDDTDPLFYPGAPEDCTDAVDYDCDGTVTYADADADGVAACEDCDDANAFAFPGGEELCNGADDDCDGDVDEASATDALTWYADADGDGWGNDGATTLACAAPSTAYVAMGGDCDDGNGDYHPYASEADCTDPEDYDCDGVVAYADNDGDGAAACIDCDDSSAEIGPGGIETCNGADDDCDGVVDEESTDAALWFLDNDGDGWGDPSSAYYACSATGSAVPIAGDCDDADAGSSPTASEVCDGGDNDCDGSVDESGALGESTWYLDADGDGYGTGGSTLLACDVPTGYAANSADCNDSLSAVNPGATESCDSVDNDCDGTTDESNATGCTVYYYDYDGDGYGSDSIAGSCSCSSAGYYSAANDDDCYDYNSTANPGATAYSATSRGDSSYDYNCDGSSTSYYTATYDCDTHWSGFSCSGYTDGFSSTAPACGSSGTWRSGCSAAWWSCSYTASTTVTQSCR